jgi:flagellar biosynthesis/type III secretory pathway chaperone
MLMTERLAQLISTKRAILTQLREIGQRQTDLAASGDIGSLLSLLGAKQSLIATLQELETALRPHYAEDPEKRSWRSAQERVACAQHASECNALLEDILRLEKLAAEKMAVRRNEVAEQLQQVHAASQVRNAYEAQRRTMTKVT